MRRLPLELSWSEAFKVYLKRLGTFLKYCLGSFVFLLILLTTIKFQVSWWLLGSIVIIFTILVLVTFIRPLRGGITFADPLAGPYTVSRPDLDIISLVLAVSGLVYISYQIGSLVPSSQIAVKTVEKEQREILLSDGSTITLNEGSELTYPKEFSGNKQRNVYLSGEAFFNVNYSQSQPFIVKTEAMQVEVLGTSFNIRAYPKESTEEVYVEHGVVKVDHGNIVNWTLRSKDKFSLDKETNNVTRQKDFTGYSIGWKTNKFRFNNVPYSEVLTAFERYYNVLIELENPELGELTFSGGFPENDFERALTIIALPMDLEYESVITSDSSRLVILRKRQ